MNLKRGKALIISGPAGSGKTRKAVDLVIAHGGKYNTITHRQLKNPFDLGHVLRTSPEIVIVDETIPDKAFFESAKLLVSAPKIRVERKYEDAYETENPIWIFLTNKPVELPEGTRRFDVITLTGEKS